MRAIRLVVSTMGAVVGAEGVEHGVGEVLQGNVPPNGVMFLAWPDSRFFAVMGGEPAMSIVPNMIATGILAIISSLILFVWATTFVHRTRNGGRILVLVSFVTLLIGGGIVPPMIGMLLGAVGTKVDSDLTWWRAHLSRGSRRHLAELWPWLLSGCLISFLLTFPGLSALSYFLGIDNTNLVIGANFAAYGFLTLSVLASFPHDIQDAAEKEDATAADNFLTLESRRVLEETRFLGFLGPNSQSLSTNTLTLTGGQEFTETITLNNQASVITTHSINSFSVSTGGFILDSVSPSTPYSLGPGATASFTITITAPSSDYAGPLNVVVYVS